MNKNLSRFSKVAIGVGVGGLVAGSAVLIYQIMKNKEDNTPKFDPQIEVSDDFFSFNINEYYESKPYLGKEGIKKLQTRIRSDLGYGPEIDGLSSINIFEGKYTDTDNNNGLFNDKTREIFINTINMRNFVPDDGKLDDKVEIVFQILFHEYGHYLASVYLNNNKPNSTTPVTDLYINGGAVRIAQAWNKHFVDGFKKMLKYDVATPYYPVKSVEKTDSKGQKKTYTLLPSQYNAKDLFDISNGLNTPAYTKDISNSIIWNNKLTIMPSPVTAHTLEYMYSMDELYTRKYQQIGMVQRVWRNGWIPIVHPVDGANFHASPFLIDTLQYQPSMDVPSHDPTTGWRFMADAPYGIDNKGLSTMGESENMFNLMLEGFGQTTGADLSFIISLNKSKLNTASTIVTAGDSKKIKFGGYIRADQNPKFVGYMNGSDFVALPITVKDFTYGYKSSLVSPTRIKATGETKFYTTNEFVDGQLLSNKQLFFSDDKEGTTKVALASIRDGIYGETSSYWTNAPNILKSHYFEAKNEKGIVKIVEEKWS